MKTSETPVKNDLCSEKLNSFSTTSCSTSASPSDILSGKSQFPTDDLKLDLEVENEQPELILPEIEQLKDGLTPQEYKELECLLHEFGTSFQQNKADFGRSNVLEHTIELEPGAVPWKEGPRRMTPFKTEKANEEIRMLSLIHI